MPPFVGYDYRFQTANLGVSGSLEFYYSLTWKTTDGTNVVTSEFLINYCKPVLMVGLTELLDRAPEWVTLNSAGAIVRYSEVNGTQEAYPNTTVECNIYGPCKFKVYAAKFVSSTGITVDANDIPLVSVDGPMVGGNVTSRTKLANNVYQVEYTVGSGTLGTHTVEDIGKYKSVCFYAKSVNTCRSMPLCFNIKILGNFPYFIPPTPPMILPTDDVKIDEPTAQVMLCTPPFFCKRCAPASLPAPCVGHTADGIPRRPCVRASLCPSPFKLRITMREGRKESL